MTSPPSCAILTPSLTKPRRSQQRHNDRPEENAPLDETIWRDAQNTIQTQEPLYKHYTITNRERSVGARLAGEIARVHPRGLPAGTIRLHLQGIAGQTFGVFNSAGVTLDLEGEAQDYVGKGMAGGEIIVRPKEGSTSFTPQENTIIGNTVMYGATGGSLYAAGHAGERLCVRNSGGRAVVEGCGDHGCEYMTGGVTVVLGHRPGATSARGCRAVMAYVLDTDGAFRRQPQP